MKNKIIFCLKNVISIIRSVFFNLRVLPLKYAIRMPILIHWRVKVHCKRGHIIFNERPEFFSVRFGFGGGEHIPCAFTGRLKIEGVLNFTEEGKNVAFTRGFSVWVDKEAVLALGDNVAFNRNSVVECRSTIDIGNDVLVGWNCTLLDSANHCVYYSDRKSKVKNFIKIQNHVWLGAHVSILNGTIISKNSVVGYGATVQGEYPESVLINQKKAQIIKEGVNWGYKSAIEDDYKI